MTMPTRYPTLRAVMSEEFDQFSDAAFESVIAQVWPDASPEDIEIDFGNIGRSIGRGLGQVGQVAQRAAPGAIGGALQGATMGAALGPYGMLAGAAIGAIGGGISSYQASRQPQQRPQSRQQPPQQVQRPQAQQPPRAPAFAPQMQPVMAPAAQPSFAPVRQPAMPAVAGAAPANGGQLLLQLLSRPEIINALLSLAMGQLGRQQIAVGTATVPTERLVGLVSAQQFGGDPGDSEGDYGYSDDDLMREMAFAAAEDHPFYRAVEAAEGSYSHEEHPVPGGWPIQPPEPFGQSEPLWTRGEPAWAGQGAY